MKTQLFFDDFNIFGRDHVKRIYGTPERIAEYNDGICSTDYSTGHIFRLPDGKYRMIYFAHSKEFRGRKCFSAISEDGIHFTPEALPENQNATYPHEVMDLSRNSEIGTIYEDPTASVERYKLLMSEAEYAFHRRYRLYLRRSSSLDKKGKRFLGRRHRASCQRLL